MDDYLECLRKSLEQDLGLVPPEPAQALLAASCSISLIITQEQREKLRENGFTEEEIRTMTPAQAHARLRIK